MADTSTQTHHAPAPHTRKKRPVLIAAFPESGAGELPSSGETLGRAWAESLGIHDSKISRQHLRLSRHSGQLQITDLGSHNGTFVNGRRLPPNESVDVEDGAVLRMGGTLWVYRESLEGALVPSSPLDCGDGRILAGPYGLRPLHGWLNRLADEKSDAGRLNVLVEGETGTGKEGTARLIAERLGRGIPYAPVNVNALPENLAESELFGHARGAFSGADKARSGLFLESEGGAIFLDELGDLLPSLQPKLLRVLEEREVRAVGTGKRETADVLVVAATNRALNEAVEEGQFRLDLLARFAWRFELPPLRERLEDLFAIVQSLFPELDPAGVEVEAVERLMLQPWRSNVRELRATVKDALTEGGGCLRAHALETRTKSPGSDSAPLSIESVRESIERHGGVAQAARSLGVDRGKLYRLLKKHGGE